MIEETVKCGKYEFSCRYNEHVVIVEGRGHVIVINRKDPEVLEPVSVIIAYVTRMLANPKMMTLRK